MTLRVPFYTFPFATAGDLTPIPMPTQLDGTLSYQQGWGPDYQRDQTTDPLAKDIDRRQMNQSLNTITALLRQYQTECFPEFIDTVDNGGVAFPYDTGTIVRWRANTGLPFANFISTASNNTQTPQNPAFWTLFNPAVKTVDNFFAAPQTIQPGSGAQAMQFQQAVGRLIAVRVFNTPGTTTYTPTPGTNSIVVEVQGAGGGGGSAPATTASQFSAAPGGGAGGFAMGRLTSGFNGASIVIGAGGPGGVGGSSGVNGTTSSFGGAAPLSCSGGSGGGAGQTAPIGTITFIGSGTAGSASGGNIVNTPGDAGDSSLIATGQVHSGHGGASHYGPGGQQTNGTSGGNSAASPGAGGSGGSSLSNGPAAGGGNGAGGQVIIYEYA